MLEVEQQGDFQTGDFFGKFVQFHAWSFLPPGVRSARTARPRNRGRGVFDHGGHRMRGVEGWGSVRSV